MKDSRNKIRSNSKLSGGQKNPSYGQTYDEDEMDDQTKSDKIKELIWVDFGDSKGLKSE